MRLVREIEIVNLKTKHMKTLIIEMMVSMMLIYGAHGVAYAQRGYEKKEKHEWIEHHQYRHGHINVDTRGINIHAGYGHLYDHRQYPYHHRYFYYRGYGPAEVYYHSTYYDRYWVPGYYDRFGYWRPGHWEWR